MDTGTRRNEFSSTSNILGILSSLSLSFKHFIIQLKLISDEPERRKEDPGLIINAFSFFAWVKKKDGALAWKKSLSSTHKTRPLGSVVP